MISSNWEYFYVDRLHLFQYSVLSIFLCCIFHPGNTAFVCLEVSEKNLSIWVDIITCFYFFGNLLSDIQYLRWTHCCPFHQNSLSIIKLENYQVEVIEPCVPVLNKLHFPNDFDDTARLPSIIVVCEDECWVKRANLLINTFIWFFGKFQTTNHLLSLNVRWAL